jgi:hypothetical protein
MLEVLGRPAELAAVERFLDALEAGPAALVFEGERGIGKTTLLRAAAAAAGRRGVRVVSSLAELRGEAAVDLPVPQRDAFARGLADGDPRALATAALALLEAQAPVIVAVDDLDALDAPRQSVLAFCARRLRGRIGIVAAGGPGAPPLPVERVEVRRLGPLAPGALQAVVRQGVDKPVARRALERIHFMSGGNPARALALARALSPAGPPPAVLPVPAALRADLDARLGPGPDDDVLLAVAGLAAPTIDLLARALGPDAEERIDAAEDRGVLARDGAAVRFTEPLLAGAVYARATPRRRRTLHRRLAAVAADVEEQGRHLAHGRVVPGAVPVLEAGARVARERGAPAAAAELLELALTFDDDAGRRVRAAGHHLAAGDATRAQALLEGLPRAEARRLRRRALAAQSLGEIAVIGPR